MCLLQKGEVGQRQISTQSSLCVPSPHLQIHKHQYRHSVMSVELLLFPCCTAPTSTLRILLSVFHFSHVMMDLIRFGTVMEMLPSIGKQTANFEEISEESFLENSQFVGLGFPGVRRNLYE